MATATASRMLEADITLFSGAEIRVVGDDEERLINLSFKPAIQGRRGSPTSPGMCTVSRVQVVLPVGEAPDELFQRYASLVTHHRQVRASTGHKEQHMHGCAPGIPIPP
jgi:hypothetical protein